MKKINKDNVPSFGEALAMIRKDRREQQRAKRSAKAEKRAGMSPQDKMRRRWIWVTGIGGVFFPPLWIFTIGFIICNSIENRLPNS